MVLSFIITIGVNFGTNQENFKKIEMDNQILQETFETKDINGKNELVIIFEISINGLENIYLAIGTV